MGILIKVSCIVEMHSDNMSFARGVLVELEFQ